LLSNITSGAFGTDANVVVAVVVAHCTLIVVDNGGSFIIGGSFMHLGSIGAVAFSSPFSFGMFIGDNCLDNSLSSHIYSSSSVGVETALYLPQLRPPQKLVTKCCFDYFNHNFTNSKSLDL
jgi:hypothetical protein